MMKTNQKEQERIKHDNNHVYDNFNEPRDAN